MKIREPRIMQHAGTNSKKEIKEGSKTYKVCYEVWEGFTLQTICSGRSCHLHPKGTANPRHPYQVRHKSNNLFLVLASCSDCSVLKSNSDPEDECSTYTL